MVDRFYGYQYETTARELQPEIEPLISKHPKKPAVEVKKQPEVKKSADNSVKVKKSVKPRIKLVMLILVGFSVLFTISYRNSVINETFTKKEQLKGELNAIQKTNEQLKVSIENSLNLNNIEQEAKVRVGMQKLTNGQKIYVSLPKKDYVESAAEEVVIEQEQNIIQKIISGFTKTIN